MRRSLTLFAGLLALSAPAAIRATALKPPAVSAGPSAPSAALPADRLLADYATHATGRFSSAAQHRADSAYDEVEAHVVRIWPERTDGIWLYQEQAILTGVAPGAAPRPYFQRVGHVTAAADGTLRRDNYTIKEALRFTGLGRAGYGGPMPTPGDLGPAGCHNILEYVSAGFWTGRTEDCANSHRGASRMISRAILARDRFVNWDRGIDAEGAHVWGPRTGGYVFDRLP
jgi:hypothetical protein